MGLFRHHSDVEPTSTLDPHQWNRPSMTFHTSSKHPKTVIPDPSIFRDAIVPAFDAFRGEGDHPYPSPGHLAVHLALLECFVKLKEKLMTSAEMSEVGDVQDGGPDSQYLLCSDDIAQTARWKVAVRVAVSRFAVWLGNIDSVLGHMSAYHRGDMTGSASHTAMAEDYLPPLDVLLVWYAYMNKSAEHCIDNAMRNSSPLRDIPLPWEAIRAVINMDSLTYVLSPAAAKLFSTITAQDPDVFIYLTQPPPYSDLDSEGAVSLDLAFAVHKLMDATGFAQKMHNLHWFRSPSLQGTLRRALVRYHALPQATTKQLATWTTRICDDPALELVWRTHMLYPAAFARYRDLVFSPDPESRLDRDQVRLKSDKDHAAISLAETVDGMGTGEEKICYCWGCERVRDEIPDYIRPTRSLASSDGCGHFSGTAPDDSLSALGKDVILEIQGDLAFYHYVERFRQSRSPGTPLPTRAPTAKAIQRQKREQRSKDRAGRYYGLGYTVEILRPAMFDQETGRVVQREKIKVKRSAHMSTTGKWGSWFLFC
jgi:hypothetical protein